MNRDRFNFGHFKRIDEHRNSPAGNDPQDRHRRDDRKQDDEELTHCGVATALCAVLIVDCKVIQHLGNLKLCPPRNSVVVRCESMKSFNDMIRQSILSRFVHIAGSKFSHRNKHIPLLSSSLVAVPNSMLQLDAMSSCLTMSICSSVAMKDSCSVAG